MNFIIYGIAIVFFKFLFWYVIFKIVGLPSLLFMPLLAWATTEEKTSAKRILLIPIVIGAFVFGNLVPTLFYSAGIFAITIHYLQVASYPMVYVVAGGLLCLWVRAPSGETNPFSILISVASYILYMTILKAFGQNVSDVGLRVVTVYLSVTIPILIICLIGGFIAGVVSKARGGQGKSASEQSAGTQQ